MRKSIGLLALAALLLAACGGGTTKGIEIGDVVFAKELSEDYQPVNPSDTFYPDETINVSVQIPGRPKQGVLGARFLYRDDLEAEASIDFKQENSDLLFSVGQDTFTGFFLTHDAPLYISPLYSVELLVDGAAVGKYPFTVIAPADAIPTTIRTTTFAADVSDDLQPIDATDVFEPSQAVYFIGAGDFGRLSYLQVDWYLDGEELIPDCTKSLEVDENLQNESFYFSCELSSGWPIGEHSVVLTVDDVAVKEETFSVK